MSGQSYPWSADEIASRISALSSKEPLLQLFTFAHLPDPLRGRSRKFAEVALWLVESTPKNPERAVALRKLREAKDCAVTAMIWKETQ